MVNQLDPESILKHVTKKGKHDLKLAPVPVSVHLISPSNATQSDVAESMKKVHKVLQVRPDKLHAAHVFLLANNARYKASGHSPAQPVLFENLPAGSFKHTTTPAQSNGAAAGTGGTHILAEDPSATAQTVHNPTQTNARSSIVITEGNENLMKAGRHVHTDGTGKSIVYAATSLYPYWDVDNVPGCYVYEMPTGTCGPGADRSAGVHMSRQYWDALVCRIYNSPFSTNADFILAEFSTIRLGVMHSVRSNYLRSNPQMSTTVMSLTEEEVAIAAKYQDDVKRARERNMQIPTKPANVSAAAEQALTVADLPTNHCIGTANYAIKQRNELFASSLLHGTPHTWNTTTPDDIESEAFYQRTCSDNATAATPAEKAQRIADDAFAVAQTYLDITDIWLKYMLGWDEENQSFDPKGGILGTFTWFALQTELQQRGAPHGHAIACNVGFPKTVAQWNEWMKSAEFRAHLFEFAKTTLDDDVGITHNDVVDFIGSVPHECGQASPPGTMCCSATSAGASSRPVGQDYIQGGERRVALAKEFIVEKEMPRKDTSPTCKWSEGTRPPPNLECQLCGSVWSAAVEAEKLAFTQLGQDIIDRYKGSNIGFNTVPVDASALVLPDLDLEKHVITKALCTLVATKFLEHHHKAACFKNSRKTAKDAAKQHIDAAARSKCRYNLPNVPTASWAVIINDSLVVTPENNHIVTLPDVIETIEFQFGTNPIYPYTSSHSNLQLLIFMCNVNYSLHCACTGAMYYITNYQTKLPDLVLPGTKQIAAFVRQINRELREDAQQAGADTDPKAKQFRRTAQRLNALSYSGSVIGVEISIAMAAIYLLRGSTMKTSDRKTSINMAVSTHSCM